MLSEAQKKDIKDRIEETEKKLERDLGIKQNKQDMLKRFKSLDTWVDDIFKQIKVNLSTCTSSKIFLYEFIFK